MKIDFPYKYLQACLPHAAKKDVRFYLCGLYLGDGFMASTDGHRLMIIRDSAFNGCNYIIPRETVTSFLRKLGKNPRYNIVTLETLDNGFNTIECMGEYEYFKFIDGKYPDVTRVDIPKPREIVAANFYFNPEYLLDFQKSAQFLTGNRCSTPEVKQTGQNSVAYIELHADNAHGVLMPMRT